MVDVSQHWKVVFRFGIGSRYSSHVDDLPLSHTVLAKFDAHQASLVIRTSSWRRLM